MHSSRLDRLGCGDTRVEWVPGRRVGLPTRLEGISTVSVQRRDVSQFRFFDLLCLESFKQSRLLVNSVGV